MALWLVLNKPDKDKAIKPAGDDDRENFAYSLGYAESEVHQKTPDDVRKLRESGWFKNFTPLDQARLLAVLAAVSLEKDGKNTTELDAFVALIESSLKGRLAEVVASGKPDVSWLMWRLVQAAVQNGHTAQATTIANAIPEPGARGRARALVLQSTLGTGAANPATYTVAPYDDSPSGLRLVSEVVARHNARRAGWGVNKVESMPMAPNYERLYGLAGILLGINEK